MMIMVRDEPGEVQSRNGLREEPLPLPSPKRGGAITSDDGSRFEVFKAPGDLPLINRDRPSPLRGGEGEGFPAAAASRRAGECRRRRGHTSPGAARTLAA